MKGHKATYDMRCRTNTYEVGKTYTISDMKMCSHGFHFCQNVADIFHYYDPVAKLIVLEIEALGKVETNEDKSVTDKIKILRVIPKEELETFAGLPTYTVENGHVTYYKNPNGGLEFWRSYDAKGNCTYYRNSLDRFYYTYDENGNILSSRAENSAIAAYEYENVYDERNLLVSRKTIKNGKETWLETWKRNYETRMTRYDSQDGCHNIFYYDSEGRKIKFESYGSDGVTLRYSTKYQYHEGKLVYKERTTSYNSTIDTWKYTPNGHTHTYTCHEFKSDGRNFNRQNVVEEFDHNDNLISYEDEANGIKYTITIED